MKKVFYLVTMLSVVLLGCTKPNNGNRTDTKPEDKTDPQEQKDDPPVTPPEPEKPKVTTCEENLVLYVSFDNDNLIEKGEGLTFKENKGQAGIATGFIGKGWTNKSGKNSTEAYSKFDVAAGSVFTKIDKVTMTVWVKNSTDPACYKGGLFSLNGGMMGDKPHDFPAMNVYFDNNGTSTDEETGETQIWQQINGRFIFHDDKGNEQNLWLDTGHPAFAIYGEWFQLAVTYDKDITVKDEETGEMVAKDQVNLYVNGMQVAARTFDYKIPFSNLVTDQTNAFYIGGWSTFIEGYSTQTWQSYWAGSMDEIRFYNKALSGEEIAALYKEELAVNLAQED